MRDYEELYRKYKAKYIHLKNKLFGAGSDIKRIHVQDPWFTFIKNKKKTVEGRLGGGYFAKLQKGERVVFYNRKTNDEVSATIIDVIKYQSFEDMLNKEKLDNVLPSIDNISQGVEVYRQFYSEVDERRMGVVAIRIQID